MRPRSFATRNGGWRTRAEWRSADRRSAGAGLSAVALALILLSSFLGACNGAADSQGVLNGTEQVEAGERLFLGNCASCHSITPGQVVVGPSLAGIAERAGGRVAGMDARSYLEESIRHPNAFVVQGFEPLMPATFNTTLTGPQIEALVEYLMTLEP